MAFVNLKTLLEAKRASPQCCATNAGMKVAEGSTSLLLGRGRPFLTRTGLDAAVAGSSPPPISSSSHNDHQVGGGGLMPSTILELCGKPSSGKTTIALSAAVEALRENIVNGLLDGILGHLGERLCGGGAGGQENGQQKQFTTINQMLSALLPTPTRVVWVSSADHHAFSPSLLFNAVHEVIIDALEAFHSREDVSALMSQALTYVGSQQGGGGVDSESSSSSSITTNQLVSVLEDPSALSWFLFDHYFSFYGNVGTPHALVSLCQSLRMMNTTAIIADMTTTTSTCTSNPSQRLGDEEGEGGSSSHLLLSAPLRFIPTGSRVLLILDCMAYVLSSIEDAPLMAAVVSAEMGGLCLVGKEDGGSGGGDDGNTTTSSTAAPLDTTASSRSTTAYQYTVHELKRQIHSLVAAWSYGASGSNGGGAADVAVIMTNLLTSVGGGAGGWMGSSGASAASTAPKALGGQVWAATATARVVVTLTEASGGAFKHAFASVL